MGKNESLGTFLHGPIESGPGPDRKFSIAKVIHIRKIILTPLLSRDGDGQGLHGLSALSALNNHLHVRAL